jgi:hypothetical protein
LGNVVPYRYEEVLAACGSSDGSRLTL